MTSQCVEAKKLSYPSKQLQQQPITISLIKVTPGWTPNKGGQSENQRSYPRMHPPNQRLGKPDKLSQGSMQKHPE